MCGLLGILTTKDSKISGEKISEILKDLYTFSESRGKDSSGILLMDDNFLKILKAPIKSTLLINSKSYKELVRKYINDNDAAPKCFIGHARMVTNGNSENYNNNQPVQKHDLCVVHNGIIVNDIKIRKQNSTFKRDFEVDTEVFLDLVDEASRNQSITNAFRKGITKVEGANTFAMVSKSSNLVNLSTSNGSFYYLFSDSGNEFIFCSEKFIIEKILSRSSRNAIFKKNKIKKLFSGQTMCLDVNDLSFSLDNFHKIDKKPDQPLNQDREILLLSLDKIINNNSPNIFNRINVNLQKKYDSYIYDRIDKISKFKRCKKCVLPETFPFIKYDSNGICNICNSYKKIKYLGYNELKNKILAKSSNGRILLPFSGGRDSSYAMHLSNEMNLDVVAYTYDWGLITDLARRNISRMCGKLGIEHILVSADIRKKRKNVKKNVEAWLKKPSLGMVPLFMAGDKQYFYYANLIKKQMNIPLTLYGMNPLERTDFKVGFCNINEIEEKEGKHFGLSRLNKIKMINFYIKEFISNPLYLNSTLLDSLSAFASYYMINDDYEIIYNYISWNENKINNVLINEYEWETSEDCDTTWRIGDATAPFYNYIYYMNAGFTEFDTFQSNLIREGLQNRKDALNVINENNLPRWDSIKWYCETIGIDFDRTIEAINMMQKIY